MTFDLDPVFSFRFGPFVLVAFPLLYMLPLVCRGGTVLVNGRSSSEVASKAAVLRFTFIFAGAAVIYSALFLAASILLGKVAINLTPGSAALTAFFTDVRTMGIRDGCSSMCSMCDVPAWVAEGVYGGPAAGQAGIVFFLQFVPAVACAALHIARIRAALSEEPEALPPMGPKSPLWPEMVDLASRFFETHEPKDASVTGRSSWWRPVPPPTGYIREAPAIHLGTDTSRSRTFMLAPPAHVPQLPTTPPPALWVDSRITAEAWARAIELPNQYLAVGTLEDAPRLVQVVFTTTFALILIAVSVVPYTVAPPSIMTRLLLTVGLPFAFLAIWGVAHQQYSIYRKRMRDARERVAYGAAQAALNSSIPTLCEGTYLRLYGTGEVQVYRSYRRTGDAGILRTRLYHFRCEVLKSAHSAAAEVEQATAALHDRLHRRADGGEHKGEARHQMLGAIEVDRRQAAVPIVYAIPVTPVVEAYPATTGV